MLPADLLSCKITQQLTAGSADLIETNRECHLSMRMRRSLVSVLVALWNSKYFTVLFCFVLFYTFKYLRIIVKKIENSHLTDMTNMSQKPKE